MYERERPTIFFSKATESFAGAQSEFVNGRFNNCANRCYYACFQAAIAALDKAGIQPQGDQWNHRFVPAQFDGQLINRRKLYPTELRTTLSRVYALRQTADYEETSVTETEASRSLRRSQTFLEAIQPKVQEGDEES
ncbi:MAG: HEPN domain-containing protein [Chloroflexi bacterium]|nr:HEPN domain-containing protein [Chloroflexota bacterium]